MPDVIHGLLKWLDHNRYTAIGMAFGLSVAVWLVACQSKTTSLLDPSIKVDRATLEREVIQLDQKLAAKRAELDAEQAALNAKIEAFNGEVESANTLAEFGFVDLDRQDQMRAEIVRLAGGAVGDAVTGNPIGAASLITSILGVLGAPAAVGVMADNRRKDKLIRTKKAAKPDGGSA